MLDWEARVRSCALVDNIGCGNVSFKSLWCRRGQKASLSLGVTAVTACGAIFKSRGEELPGLVDICSSSFHTEKVKFNCQHHFDLLFKDSDVAIGG